jgi:hypothetical protein
MFLERRLGLRRSIPPLKHKRESARRAASEGRTDSRLAVDPMLDTLFLQVSDGLQGCNLEPLATADVLAAENVVAAEHVAGSFSEPGAGEVVSPARWLLALAPHEPVHRVLVFLAAVGAHEQVIFLLCSLIEKIPLIHCAPALQLHSKPFQEYAWAPMCAMW